MCKLLISSIIFFSISAKALCVSSSRANLRDGPGPSHKMTWTVPRFTPLLEIQKKGSWYQVEDQDGEKHWVYSQNVSKKMQCISVKVDSGFLRQGPGAEHPLGDIWRADRYTPFKRLDVSDNGWYQVEAPWGGTYWISASIVWRPIRVRDISY